MFSIWKEGLCFITIFLPHFTFDAVCLSVGRLVYQQFSFIFFEEVAHTAIKFGIQNYNILSRSSSISGNDRTIFDRIMLLGLIENSNHMQFPFIFFEEFEQTCWWQIEPTCWWLNWHPTFSSLNMPIQPILSTITVWHVINMLKNNIYFLTIETHLSGFLQHPLCVAYKILTLCFRQELNGLRHQRFRFCLSCPIWGTALALYLNNACNYGC